MSEGLIYSSEWLLLMYNSGTQIVGSMSPGWLNILLWCLIFLPSWYLPSFMSPLWYLKVWDGC